MKTIILNRDWQDENQTLGVCYVKDENGSIIFKSEAIERGWLDNQKRISCIPTGEYPVKLEYSDRFRKKLYEIFCVVTDIEMLQVAALRWLYSIKQWTEILRLF